jgi:ribonuclease P protein component
VLPKENRLKNKSDFENVFEKGKAFREDFLFLKRVENNLEETRFGIIVSKKVSNKAVIRNKARRRISDVITLNLLNIKKGMDVVIIAGNQIKEKSFKDIKEKEIELLSKAGLIC